MKQLPLIVSIIALGIAGVALYMQQDNKKNKSIVRNPVSGDSSAVSGNFRIGYFEMDSIENKYEYVKDSYTQVKAKEEAINNELGSIEKNYQKKISEWQQRGSQMSQSESEQVQKEYAQMQQSYQSRKMNLEQELNDLRNKKLRDIQTKIEEYLREYNKEKGYAFIFSYEPALFIYYKDSAYNITPDLLNGLNSEYLNAKKK